MEHKSQSVSKYYRSPTVRGLESITDTSIKPAITKRTTAIKISINDQIIKGFFGDFWIRAKTRNAPLDIPIEYAMISKNPNVDA